MASAAALPEPARWAGPLLAVAAVAGIVLAAASTWIHYQVVSSGGAYTSFCNVSDTVNCDSVVTSPHGKILAVPVSVWALAFYAAFGFVALRASGAPSDARDRARADAFGLAIGGAVFSAYMAAVSLVVLRTVCLLCAGLYAVAAVSVFAAWMLAAPVAESFRLLGRRFALVRRRPALATSAAVVIALVLLLPAWLGAPTRMTREEVFRSNPKFFDWYTSQPVVDAPGDGGQARGPESAPIQLVEFSDFECPHCRTAHV
ncbi:MAG: vitamin K epoxide reductase family protein, partial [Candidatus Binatia bacterium]